MVKKQVIDQRGMDAPSLNTLNVRVDGALGNLIEDVPAHCSEVGLDDFGGAFQPNPDLSVMYCLLESLINSAANTHTSTLCVKFTSNT